MANENGSTSPVLEELLRLQSAASETDFFQFLRRVEALYRDQPRLGFAAHPREEPVRLGQRPSTAFAPTAIKSFVPGTNNLPPHRVEVAFMGMFGPNGPLPLALTEYAQRSSAAARRIKLEDPFVDLVDMFHQRVLTLLYRSWASSRPVVQHDRPSDNAFEDYLAALTGHGEPSRSTTGDMRSFARHFAGLYANQTRNAEGLETVACALLGAPVEVEPLIGEWIDIPEDYAWKLGHPAPRNTRDLGLLGESAVLGPQVFERQYKFRLIVGPVADDVLKQLLPGGTLLTRLKTLVRSYVGDELRWDLRVLLSEQMRSFRLGEVSSLGDTTYLAIETADTIAQHMVDPFAA
jgi:type VI secretion system protein ImpH